MKTQTDPLLGQTLDGRYEILEVVGRGGIGVVYRARQAAAAGRDVAVKVLSRASVAAGASSALRFENEAKIIGALKHPNTIKLFDTGRTEDGRLYVVTEFLAGETLMARIERDLLGQQETASVMLQIARSLDEAHARGIVHRDLKLANVVLEPVGAQEVVKVLDFGIAKLVDSQRITAPMQVFGTPGYMSPEQCSGQDVDPRSDLYALGVVGYLCLSGHLPHDETTPEGLVGATVREAPVPLSARLVGRVDPALEALIMQLLAKEPAARLPSAAATADVLESILRSLDRTGGVALEPAPSRPSPSRPHVPSRPPSAALRDPSKAFFDSRTGSTDTPTQTPSDSRDTIALPPRSLPGAAGADLVDTAAETERSARFAVQGPGLARNVALAVLVAVVVGGIVVALLTWSGT